MLKPKGSVATTTTGGSTTPIQTDSTCNRYYTFVPGDSCAAIQSHFSITFAQLYSWNPDIGSDSEYLVIGKQYCVARSGLVTATTTSIYRALAVGQLPMRLLPRHKQVSSPPEMPSIPLLRVMYVGQLKESTELPPTTLLAGTRRLVTIVRDCGWLMHTVLVVDKGSPCA